MRYKMLFSYNGSNYSGYQIQKDKDTIQAHIESSLKEVIKEDIDIVASGRTDAGVSAIEQVCHFDTNTQIDCRKTMGYCNTLLPSDIRIIDIEPIDNDFHARYSSKKKTYDYYIYIGKAEIPVYENIATHIGYDINVDNMMEACKYLVGTFDFSSFCASNTSIVDKVRTIYNAEIVRIDDRLIKFTITGNGFLYNMVRIIMGTLVAIGIGKINPIDMIGIIDGKDRSKAGKTMPSKGLYLKKVEY